MKERGLRMKLRIMTYNIHSGRDAWGRLDLAAIGEFIRTLNPDILALNEVRMGTSDVNGDEQARTLAVQLGMHWTFAPAIPYLGGQYRHCRPFAFSHRANGFLAGEAGSGGATRKIL